MANRRDYYYRQLVTEAELDAGFEGEEQAARDMFADVSLYGVCSGQAVTQHTPQNLTVDVSTGVSYDQDGQRCSIASIQTVDVSVDSSAVSTSVTTPGNEKWVSLFIKFARELDDVRVDGNDDSIFFVRDESFTIHKVQGAEAAIGVATRPALIVDGILLADVQRTQGQTQILTANISTTRRQLFAAQLMTAAGGYAGGSAWLDGTTNPAASIEAQLDKIVTDLIDSAGSNSGAHKLGCDARTTWLGGRTNPSGVSIFAAIDKIITDLAATTAADDGAERIGLQARTAWLGGRTNPAADVFAGIDKIITDLAATTASDDGSERIGAEAYNGSAFNLAAGSVKSQLREIADMTGVEGSFGVADELSAETIVANTTIDCADLTVSNDLTVENDAEITGALDVDGLSTLATLDVTGLLQSMSAGVLAILGRLIGPEEPITATLTASQNDWAPTGIDTAFIVRVDSNGGHSIGGLAVANPSSRFLLFISVGTNGFTFLDEAGGSAAANRIKCPDDASAAVQALGAALLWYHPDQARWRVLFFS